MINGNDSHLTVCDKLLYTEQGLLLIFCADARHCVEPVCNAVVIHLQTWFIQG